MTEMHGREAPRETEAKGRKAWRRPELTAMTIGSITATVGNVGDEGFGSSPSRLTS